MCEIQEANEDKANSGKSFFIFELFFFYNFWTWLHT